MHARHIVNGRPTPINLAKAVQLVADAVQAFIAEVRKDTFESGIVANSAAF